MKIETILDQIDLGAMSLPESQCGYVGTVSGIDSTAMRRESLCRLFQSFLPLSESQ